MAAVTDSQRDLLCDLRWICHSSITSPPSGVASPFMIRGSVFSLSDLTLPSHIRNNHFFQPGPPPKSSGDRLMLMTKP